MQTTFSCIIVDDNIIDRLTTLSYARKHSFLSIDGVFENAEKALNALPTLNPDVLLLDIDMPGISGLALRAQLSHIPVCIFITAYADYAVEGFENDALDFLVKPIKADRFTKAMDRTKEYLSIRKKASLLDNTFGPHNIYIKDGHGQTKINLQEVVYLEALKDYTSIVTTEKKYCVHTAMGNLIKEPGFSSFIRIHRSYAIQKSYIRKVSASAITVHTTALPVGRTYKDVLSNL